MLMSTGTIIIELRELNREEKRTWTKWKNYVIIKLGETWYFNVYSLILMCCAGKINIKSQKNLNLLE